MSRTQIEPVDGDARYALSTIEAETVIFKSIREGHIKKLSLKERFEGLGVSYVDIKKRFFQVEAFSRNRT